MIEAKKIIAIIDIDQLKGNLPLVPVGSFVRLEYEDGTARDHMITLRKFEQPTPDKLSIEYEVQQYPVHPDQLHAEALFRKNPSNKWPTPTDSLGLYDE